ncbi:unnamed protein product [Caenorhabditis angaria]|uniref:Uncharacterized protein n=1 Tax=Caenorhabditis angaria TaxID=860376 RepID=A0A9P1IKR8_9PELO|nr:unnamed protein product [Caenorhabditis angaria]
MTLTAEERRQRRMAKILENPEGRIQRILGENRLPPAMEGGECFKIEKSNEIAEFAPPPFAPIIAGDAPSVTPTVAPKKNFDVAAFAFVLGLASRFLMLFTGPINIGILWMILYFSIFLRFSTAGINPDVRNDIMVFIGALGEDHFVKKLFNAFFYLLEFIQTTITFVASHLLIHTFMEIFDNFHKFELIY